MVRNYTKISGTRPGEGVPESKNSGTRLGVKPSHARGSRWSPIRDNGHRSDIWDHEKQRKYVSALNPFASDVRFVPNDSDAPRSCSLPSGRRFEIRTRAQSQLPVLGI